MRTLHCNTTHFERPIAGAPRDPHGARPTAPQATHPSGGPVRRSDIPRIFRSRYPCETKLSDGTPILLRLVRPDDKAELLAGFARLTPESRYRRFLGGIAALSPSMLRYFTEIDYVDHFALGALVLDPTSRIGIGVARYIRHRDAPSVAEPAFTVIDRYQQRGLGHLLMDHLMNAAASQGVIEFEAVLLTDNDPMRALFADYGARFRAAGAGTLVARMPVCGRPIALGRYRFLEANVGFEASLPVP